MNQPTKETKLRCTGWDGPCDSYEATRRRQNTQYEDEERNWVTLCDRCMEANHDHWADLWSSYYYN
jgi:hypothetical protein